MSDLTAAQVWYVAQVYPEHVTDQEAQEEYEKRVIVSADRIYWNTAAKVLNDLAAK